MLYDLWLSIVRARGREMALWERSSGRRWSFAELLRAAEAQTLANQPLAFPQGHSAEFILTVLRAWRAGAIVCPLEPDQHPPKISPPPPAVCHLKMTSATSGLPKMVAFTAEQLAADAQNIVATMGLRPEWPNLGAISLAHSYGFSNLVLPLLLHGVPLILSPSPLPEMLKAAAVGYDELTLAGVPALWRAWREANAIPACVKLGISAGAPLPLALERSIHAEVGLKVHNFYGSSECGGIAYDPSPAPRAEDSCVGQPMCNVDLALGSHGCLEVRSRAVGETYWPEPNANLGNGVFRTSDLAELKDGRVYLRGRVGDLINVAGRKVAPETVERALSRHPLVKECLVFGSPEPSSERAERIIACVVSDKGCEPESLKHFLLSTLPPWQVPREFWFVESLTANSRGKLSRAEWRARYQATVHRPPRP